MVSHEILGQRIGVIKTRAELTVAAGCLFSIAEQNDINAIYPNMSIYHYWAKSGAPMMR